MTIGKVLNRCCIICDKWLILSATLAVSFVLNACTPSVVRTSNSNLSKPKDITTSQKNVKKQIKAEDKIREFEEKLASSNSFNDSNFENENTINSQNISDLHDSERRLPTLREQMQTISEEQVLIKNKVNTLQNDVIEIKYVLEEIKTALEKGESIKRKPAVAGQATTKSHDDEVTISKDNNLLLPDEKVEVKPVMKKKASPQPVNSQPIKKADTKVIVETKTNEPAEVPGEPKDIMSEALNDFAKNMFSESIVKLQGIIASSKDEKLISEANYWIAENHKALNNFDQAINHYNLVLKSNSSARTDDATSKIAECLLKVGQTNEAKNYYNNLINKYPKSEFVPKARKILQQM